jgi:hypothetical protein
MAIGAGVITGTTTIGIIVIGVTGITIIGITMGIITTMGTIEHGNHSLKPVQAAGFSA